MISEVGGALIKLLYPVQYEPVETFPFLLALLTRVHSVQTDVEKFASENATLQMYIDNLTMQMARRK